MGLFRRSNGSDGWSTEDSAPAELPIWPSGIARFTDGMLEVTTGEGLRVAARDILAIEGTSARSGRLSLTVSSRLGLGKLKRSYWVDARDEQALRELVHAVRASLRPV